MKTPKTSRKALGTGSPTFSALLEALPHLVVMTDAHGGAHQLNARWLEYTGLSLQQSQNLGWLEAIHPYDRKKPDPARADPIWDWEHSEPQPHASQPLELEYRLRRFDGVYRWFLGRHTTLSDPDGQLSGWVCTATEVDSRRRNQDNAQLEALNLERERLFEQLALERARLEAVLAQMPPGVVVADADNRRVSLVNPQLERIYGIPLTPGMALERLERPTFRPGGKRYKGPSPLGRALEGKCVSGEELEIERPDGSRAVVLTSAAPIYDRQGKLVAAVLTCEDLSQRRLDQAELRHLNREIQRGRAALTLHGGVPVTPERFLELMGELYAQFGQPQLEGRLIALLLLKVEPVSLSEVAHALEVSKVAVSKVSQVMLGRGDLQIIKSFSSREHLLALTDHNYIRDLSVRRVASWAISILCESLLETNHLDPGITEQIRAHLELHTRVAVTLEGVLSPLERRQASVLAEHLRANWDAVLPKDPVTARDAVTAREVCDKPD